MTNKNKFKNWMSDTGLSNNQATQALGVSLSTIKRMKRGVLPISSQIKTSMYLYDKLSMASINKHLHAEAVRQKFDYICTESKYGYISGVTSAIARGWLDESYNDIIYLGLPINTGAPEKIMGKTIKRIYSINLPHGIHHRIPEKSCFPYRIASIDRTVMDCCICPETSKDTYLLASIISGALKESRSLQTTLDLSWVYNSVIKPEVRDFIIKLNINK